MSTPDTENRHRLAARKNTIHSYRKETMIIVKLNDSNFEYDIHSLVKAFYPSENVSVCAEEKEPTEAVRAFLQMDTRFESTNCREPQEDCGSSGCGY